MFFSLFRQREATKRDHVARSGQNKSDSLNCAAELASLKQSSHCLKAPFSNRRICYLPSRYRNYVRSEVEDFSSLLASALAAPLIPATEPESHPCSSAADRGSSPR